MPRNYFSELLGIKPAPTTVFDSENWPFWVQVTSYDGSLFYGWQEVIPGPNASGGIKFTVLDGGKTGTTTIWPLYAANGETIPLNSYALIRRAYYDTAHDWEWVAIYIAGGGDIDEAYLIITSQTGQLVQGASGASYRVYPCNAYKTLSPLNPPVAAWCVFNNGIPQLTNPTYISVGPYLLGLEIETELNTGKPIYRLNDLLWTGGYITSSTVTHPNEYVSYFGPWADQTTNYARVIAGQDFVQFGGTDLLVTPGLTAANFPQLVGGVVAGLSYLGQTGTDSRGNMFINGICILIGGG